MNIKVAAFTVSEKSSNTTKQIKNLELNPHKQREQKQTANEQP